MQDSGSLAEFKVTARDHYKGPLGAFVTYCNISCYVMCVEVIYVMGKALTGKLSCLVTGFVRTLYCKSRGFS